MKSAVGVLAVLLLGAAVAMSQDYQPKPFPQEANTALAGTSSQEMSPVADQSQLPSSMAANNEYGAAEEVVPSNRADNGSPFPSAANPNLGVAADQIGTHTDDQVSPFPHAANPSRNW
jgi:hypothetical protein